MNCWLRNLITLRVCLTFTAFVGTIGLNAAIGVATNLPLPSQSQPKDIREIFLTLPAPDNVDDLFGDLIRDTASRKGLLDRADFSNGNSILDIPNGYLKIAVLKRGSGSAADRRGAIVVTSFSKRNRDRLVVLQFSNFTDYPDTVVDDHFYSLSAAGYKHEEAGSVLPRLSFLGDFWGEQPQPDKAAKDFVASSGDAAFYTIEWPRNGTVARAVSRIPYSDTDSKEMARTQRALAKRQYQSIELAWDRDRGAFTKGARLAADESPQPRGKRND